MLRRQVLRVFGVVEPWCAWGLLIGGLITFVGVAIGLIVVGDARPATLLVAADLVVSGFTAVQGTDDET